MRLKKYKNLSKVLVVTLLMVASFGIVLQGSAAAAAIPAGCPGSDQGGPGTYDCSSIPLGCPGSTQQSPAANTPTNCPFAAPAAVPTAVTTQPASDARYHCGTGDGAVSTSIDLGCRGQGNPILDMMFAIIRLLSNGVGLVIIGSIIVGGIQYTMSAGDPQKTAQAIGRIRSTIIALGLYIFAYPLLNYLLPAGFF